MVQSQTQAGFQALLIGLQAASELGLPNLRAQGSHDLLNMVRPWLIMPNLMRLPRRLLSFAPSEPILICPYRDW